MLESYLGIKIIEVSDPKNPVLAGRIVTGVYNTAVAVITMLIGEKFYALVADSSAGLELFEIKLSNKYRNYFSPIINSNFN